MNRSLKLSMLLALALGSSQAAALQLGQIQVKSALGEPLLAEIPLTPASPAELQNLSARLASSEEFERAGITDGRPNVPLQFSVANENGGKVIRITSTEAVDNPYLDLLIEVNSRAGSSVREYTILLDPPGSSMAQQAPVSSAPAPAYAPPRSSAAPAASAAPVPHPASAAASRPSAPSPAARSGEYGPIAHGQSLSSVARATVPQGVDINQMMLALKAANPDAFYRDNINALKTGAVLRVPSRENALAVSIAAAAEAVRQQNGDWRSGAARAPTEVAQAGAREGTSGAPGGESGDRLALVPPKEGAGGAAGPGGKQASAASIRQELQRSQETLTSLQQQSSDLKTRLKDLEDINGKNERLLALKDNEIAELQQKLTTARKAAGQPAVAPASAAAPASSEAPASQTAAAAAHPGETPSKPVAASTAAATAPVASATAQAPAVAKPVAKPALPKPATPAPAPAPEQPWYMQLWVWAAGLAALVVLLLLAMRGRRRQPAPGQPAARPSAPSLADHFGTAQPSAPHTENADPDQDELLDQLAEHPDDIDLHLELVSLYYSRRDVEHFEAAAEAMHAHITSPDQDEWQDVLHMGEDLAPGHPLFARAAPAVPPVPPQNEDEHEALHQFDLDSYATAPALDEDEGVHESESESESEHAAHSTVSEYHYDFDLTPHHAEAPASPRQHEPAPAPQDEEAVSGWKFDETAEPEHAAAADHEFGSLHDDPVDTKLDLARAYLDMGDPEGARAMLDEVMQEGSQMQRDVAQGLLDKLR